MPRIQFRVRTIMLAALFAAFFMGILMAVLRSPLGENPFHDTYPEFLMILIQIFFFPIIAFLAFLATVALVWAVQFAVSRNIFRSLRRQGSRRSRMAGGPDPRADVDRSGDLKKV